MDWNRVLASFITCVVFFATLIGICFVERLSLEFFIWPATYINSNPEILKYWPIVVGVVIFIAVWTHIYKSSK